MAINKVEFYGNTLIDLTDLSVEQRTLLKNYKAINNAGIKIQGGIPLYQGSISYTTNGREVLIPEGCYRLNSSSSYNGSIALSLPPAGTPIITAMRLDTNHIRVFVENNYGGFVESGRTDNAILDLRTLKPTSWEVDVLAIAYPVGSVYMSFNETDPTDLFGGTWERLKDAFLLAAGDTYEAGSEGGEAEHVLTVDEMPSHTHGFKNKSSALASGSSYARMASDGSAISTLVTATGGSQPHNNMPPYIAVYMWKRTA